MKYIIFQDGSVEVFETGIHSWRAGGKPVASAGFYEGGKAYGESTALGVKSRPEDSEIIKRSLLLKG